MKFKNILNLQTPDLTPRGKRISHYNINSSVMTSKDLGAKKVFFDIKELLPGQLSCPYHYHSDNEEIFIIIEGEVTLRQDNETRIVKKGDLIFFSNSPEAAHQLFNHTNSKVRYLDVTTTFGTDVCAYPDSKKINAGNKDIYKIDDRVDYYIGEENIPVFWKEI